MVHVYILLMTAKSALDWNEDLDKQTSLHSMANDNWSIVTAETTKKDHTNGIRSRLQHQHLLCFNTEMSTRPCSTLSIFQLRDTINFWYSIESENTFASQYDNDYSTICRTLQQKWSYIIISSRRNVNIQQTGIMKLISSLNNHHLRFSLWFAIFSRAKTQRVQLVRDYTDQSTLSNWNNNNIWNVLLE